MILSNGWVLEAPGSPPNIKKPQKGPFYIWRRDRDSNPGYAINVYTLSRRAP
jgi:hypothetical protein